SSAPAISWDDYNRRLRGFTQIFLLRSRICVHLRNLRLKHPSADSPLLATLRSLTVLRGIPRASSLETCFDSRRGTDPDRPSGRIDCFCRQVRTEIWKNPAHDGNL